MNESHDTKGVGPKVHLDRFIIGPLDNLRYEAHLCFDKNFSGVYADEPSINLTMLSLRPEKRLFPFTHWLQYNECKRCY
jgi:hypothetical protein